MEWLSDDHAIGSTGNRVGITADAEDQRDRECCQRDRMLD
jgi:hypothetical protein